MNYPKYPVSIYYYKRYMSGQTEVSISGVTQSMPTYSGGFYVAQMAYANILATGSTYEICLDNLLAIATASTTPDPGIVI
jgi:hypothetical protein